MSLPKIKHKAIDEIEDRDMDEGRFFIHLKPEYSWTYYDEDTATKSFGSAAEARLALKNDIRPARGNSR